ncbi:MAG: hypothetical protein LBJ90_06725 [Treponema sp.]|jgi:hypothetical protein|nr:hypothetical protein [Treponema sp.]
MKKKFFLSGIGVALILAGLLALTACPESPASEESVSRVEVTGFPDKVNGKPAYKIFVQVSKGMGIEDGYVAKGGKLISGTSAVVDLLDPNGNPWEGKGTYNVAVVISSDEVTSTDDIMVMGDYKLTSRIGWNSLPGDLKAMNMTQQIQDVFEGIVCAGEEKEVKHPAQWIGTDQHKTVFLLSKAGSKAGKDFSLNLGRKLDLPRLFLITGTWNLDARNNGTYYILLNPDFKVVNHNTGDPVAADFESDAKKLSGKLVKFEYNASLKTLKLSSTDPVAVKFFGTASLPLEFIES